MEGHLTSSCPSSENLQPRNYLFTVRCYFDDWQYTSVCWPLFKTISKTLTLVFAVLSSYQLLENAHSSPRCSILSTPFPFWTGFQPSLLHKPQLSRKSHLHLQDIPRKLNTEAQTSFASRLLSSKVLCAAGSTFVTTECHIFVVLSSLNIWSNELTHFLICRILSASECLPVLHVNESVTELLNPIHVPCFSTVEHPVYLIIYFFFESYMTFNQKPQSGN